jgi:hypothetical protein
MNSETFKKFHLGFASLLCELFFVFIILNNEDSITVVRIIATLSQSTDLSSFPLAV